MDHATLAAPSAATGGAPAQRPTPFYKHLYVQVLAAIAIGALIGYLFPAFGASLKPLGDAFIKLIKMMIAPIIFFTVVTGIAKIGDMREVGRVGLKAFTYFEVVSTLALVIGLVVVNLVRPGAGMNIDPKALDTSAIESYTKGAQSLNTVDFLLHMIPDTVLGAFASGEILQVLLFSILFGVALARFGEKGKPVADLLDHASHLFFDAIGLIMRLAPVGAFGAMAFTVGKYGVGSLFSLGKLMACVYITCALFVFVVLNAIARATGFSLWKFLGYIREEILIVLGTSSSEAALPRMLAKLENLGCAKPVVGLTIPAGYSFNLDGTSIYLTMAALFVAQATNVQLDLGQQLTILAVLLLTSKGAAAVTGGGFITLAATLATIGTVPVAGLALLLGVDRFMSEARAITNLIGNGVATVVVSRWDGALDRERMRRVLDGEVVDAEAQPTALAEGQAAAA
ncbi:dicarboxylate/amino acid:cation symporter [Chloroflexia bacterium SDU3-3]|nr:dicarboxylate/amino acid:cation symporter [Chloroflexia bacterium SDU3-3]